MPFPFDRIASLSPETHTKKNHVQLLEGRTDTAGRFFLLAGRSSCKLAWHRRRRPSVSAVLPVKTLCLWRTRWDSIVAPWPSRDGLFVLVGLGCASGWPVSLGRTRACMRLSPRGSRVPRSPPAGQRTGNPSGSGQLESVAVVSFVLPCLPKRQTRRTIER